MDSITCPNCQSQVFLKADGICPSCQATLTTDEQGRVSIARLPGKDEAPISSPTANGRQLKKPTLIAVAFLLVGLILVRVLVAWGAAGEVKTISQKYLAEWSGIPGTELLSKMEQSFNAINPRPFGFPGDGLFNEPFDDEVAFDPSGLVTLDAHDAIAGLAEHFQITGVILKQSLLSTAADKVAMSTRLVNLGGMLVTYRFKARIAQELGMWDTLIGLAGIALLGLIVITFLQHRAWRKTA